MDYYDVAQVCLNGHVITSMSNKYPSEKRDRCDQCGEKTICECQNCNEQIQGFHHMDSVILGFEFFPPRFCHKCGFQMPWIESKLQATKDIVDLMESLEEKEKDDFKDSIGELVKETAKAPLAKIKVKKYLKKVDSDISNSLREVLEDILSDEVKDSII